MWRVWSHFTHLLIECFSSTWLYHFSHSICFWCLVIMHISDGIRKKQLVWIKSKWMCKCNATKAKNMSSIANTPIIHYLSMTFCVHTWFRLLLWRIHGDWCSSAIIFVKNYVWCGSYRDDKYLMHNVRVAIAIIFIIECVKCLKRMRLEKLFSIVLEAAKVLGIHHYNQ